MKSTNFLAVAKGGEGEIWKHKRRPILLKRYYPPIAAEQWSYNSRGRYRIYRGALFEKRPWVHGVNFRQYCSECKNLEKKIFLLGRAASALDDQCKQRGRIFHGDISPENLIITPAENPIWIDWPPIIYGRVCAKSAYMAPEKALSFQDTVASEIYSLGIMLRELCFDEETLARALHQYPWRRFSSFSEFATVLHALGRRRNIDSRAHAPSAPKKE